MELYKKLFRIDDQYKIVIEYLSVVQEGQPASANLIWNYMFDLGFHNWHSSSISLKMDRLMKLEPRVKRISAGTYLYT